MSSPLRGVRHVALDLDGTLYLGSRRFDDVPLLFDALKQHSIGRSFITNNCSLSREQYLAKLHALGIDAQRDEIQTSAHATIHDLQTHHPDCRRLHVLGTEGLHSEFEAAGYNLTSGQPDDEPDAVIVGYDTTLTYDKLCRAAYWLSQGKRFIATHPDRVCPTNELTLLPDCGAICALLTHATGRSPDRVPGKPDAMMLQVVLRHADVAEAELAMVGDRLYTDMRMARDAGAVGVLVLTGETSREDVEAAPPEQRPSLVVENLTELASLLLAAQKEASC